MKCYPFIVITFIILFSGTLAGAQTPIADYRYAADFFKTKDIVIGVRTDGDFYPDDKVDICVHIRDYFQQKLAEVMPEETIRFFGCGERVPGNWEDILMVNFALNGAQKPHSHQNVSNGFILFEEQLARKHTLDCRRSHDQYKFDAQVIPWTENPEALKKDIYRAVEGRLDNLVNRVAFALWNKQYTPTPEGRVRNSIKVYEGNPQKVMKAYLRHRELYQRGGFPYHDSLSIYEHFLQQHDLIDSELTHDDLVREYFIGLFELYFERYKDNSEVLVRLYNSYKIWHEERGISFTYLGKYEDILRKEGLLK
jgi:hypothetical protein